MLTDFSELQLFKILMTDSKQYLKKKKRKKPAHALNASSSEDDRSQMNIAENIMIDDSHAETSMLNDILMNLNAAEKSFKKMNMIQNEDLISAAENILQNENMNFDNNINILQEKDSISANLLNLQNL